MRRFCPGLIDRIDTLPGFDPWYDRVAAIGHGRRSDMSAADALAVAAAAEPAELGIAAGDEGLAGKTVTLAAADYGRDPITGTFAGSTPYSLAVTRSDAQVGRITVHVPRVGYSATPA